MAPRILRTFVVDAALATALLMAWGCASPPRPQQAIPSLVEPVGDPAEMASALVEAHNRVRAEKGLPALTLNPQLEAAARRHASDMAERRRMAHRGSNGSSPFRRMQDEGYQFTRAAENVAMGQPTLDVLMKDWMHSAGHRRNILGNYSEIGAAGAVDKSGNPYWCVTFGTPMAR